MFFRNKINFLIAITFLYSCSSMNVTEERVYSGDVKTVEALSSDSIQYDNKAVFASATVYFEFDKSNLTSKSIQILKSVASALNENKSIGFYEIAKIKFDSDIKDALKNILKAIELKKKLCSVCKTSFGNYCGFKWQKKP